MYRKPKPSIFQVLLLDNDSSLDVEVRESEQVNFSQIKAHLRNGGSVFITSKGKQKILHPKTKAQCNLNTSRRKLGFLFRQRIKNA
jgi:hypothetical protein